MYVQRKSKFLSNSAKWMIRTGSRRKKHKTLTFVDNESRFGANSITNSTFCYAFVSCVIASTAYRINSQQWNSETGKVGHLVSRVILRHPFAVLPPKQRWIRIASCCTVKGYRSSRTYMLAFRFHRDFRRICNQN